MAGPETLTATATTRRTSVVGRHGATVVAMAVGAAVTIVGSWLPWLHTGNRSRHSYDIFALVERLGFSPDGAVGVLVRWWPLVPLVTVAAVVLAWWGWRRIGGGLGIVGGLYAGGVGVAVARAPAVVEIGLGPRVTAVGGLILVVASGATCAVSHLGRIRPTDPAR